MWAARIGAVRPRTAFGHHAPRFRRGQVLDVDIGRAGLDADRSTDVNDAQRRAVRQQMVNGAPAYAKSLGDRRLRIARAFYCQASLGPIALAGSGWLYCRET